MKKNILVTGGKGFIGGHLVKRLKKERAKVVVVDRKSGVDINSKKLENIFKENKFNCVVHLAAEVGVRDSFKRFEEYMYTNAVGTYMLLKQVKKYGVKQFVFASSSSVYGKRKGRKGFKETDKLSPISPYAYTKQVAEQVCQVSLKKTGVKLTVLRFFTVYGPNNRQDMAVFKFIDAIAQGRQIEIYGHNTKRDFTYVDDIVEAIVKVIKKPLKNEVINLGNCQPITILKLVKTIEKYLGKKAKIKKMPLPQGDVPVTFANISKAKRLLGWHPETDIETGIKDVVGWYNAEYA